MTVAYMMYACMVLVFHILFLVCKGDQISGNKTDIVVGHCYSFGYRGHGWTETEKIAYKSNSELAAKHVSEVVGDINIRIIPNRTGCYLDFQVAMAKTAFQYFTDGVHALLGPDCDPGMEKIGTFAGAWDWPVIGYASPSESLASKREFPTLSRVSFSLKEFASGTTAFLDQFKWKKVAYIYRDEPPCDKGSFFNSFKREARSSKIDITYEMEISHCRCDRNEYVRALKEIQRKARIVILCMGFEIADARDFLAEAHNLSMTGNDYAYIGLWGNRQFMPLPWEYNDEKDALMRKLFSKIFVMLLRGYDYELFKPWLKTVEKFTKAKYNVTEPQFRGKGVPLSLMHDGLLLYGRTVSKCLKTLNCTFTSGKDLFNLMKNQVFQGASGRVVMSDTADRLPDYIIQTFSDDKWRTHFSLNFKKVYLPGGVVQLKWNFILETPFHWSTHDGKPPLDTPLCDFDGSKCKKSYTVEIVIGAVIGVIILLTVIGLGVRGNNKKIEKLLLAQAWRIDADEVQKIGRNFQNSMRSIHSLRSVQSQNPLAGETENEVRALCRGRDVLMYVYPKKETIEFTKRQDLLFLKELRDLQHDNVNAFVGICLDQTDIKTVWNYCQKEGLEDILYNNEIQLDEMFKSSIFKDLVRGLHYIHQSKLGAHGRLLIRKCYVDSRWVVKISDCYIEELLSQFLQKGSLELSHKLKIHELIETAPEFVRSLSEKGTGDSPTPEADIYGLGMIFFQVLFRERPFNFNDISEEAILKRIKAKDELLVHPVFPEDLEGCHPSVITLLEHCWDENPDQRPTIHQVKNVINETMNKHSGNLVDHMVKLMEQYAKNLEKMVETRTKELIDERERADQLLFRMLPVSIALQLKRGVAVQPEFFDSVTLMFTDIVGFTNICSQSTPEQVVKMMNDYYSDFDEISEQFDVYKVETIGDAYMVASGLPIRNGTKHVKEIANLALTYMKLTINKGIDHLPGKFIQTRAGIHSGPAAAGVVGLQMPHYCLFGDTVNMASRMESSGLPMKIQLSQSSKELLEDDDKYEIVHRGEIDIKGKGCQSTYWLNKMKAS